MMGLSPGTAGSRSGRGRPGPRSCRHARQEQAMGSPARRNRWLTVSAPGLRTLHGYQRAWLRGDLIAGVTVAAYLIPQVMAYAGLAGLPPVTGLWAALPPLA